MSVERRTFVDIRCTAIAVGARMEWWAEVEGLWIRSRGDSTAMNSECNLLIGAWFLWTRSNYAKVLLVEPQNQT